MTNQTKDLASIAFVALLGLTIFTGFAYSNALHDVAHDMRHAAGFPCH